jgi:hypothetical protein
MKKPQKSKKSQAPHVAGKRVVFALVLVSGFVLGGCEDGLFAGLFSGKNEGEAKQNGGGG